MKSHHSTLSRVFFTFVCIAVVALALPGVGQRTEAQQIPPAPGSPSPGETYAPDQLLLRFRPGVAGQRADEILAQRGLTRMRRVEALQVDVLRLPPGLSVERAVAIYSRHPLVEFAEPNYVLQAQEEISDQWGLRQVRAVEAWVVLGTDLPGVLLATVDTGIDRNHSDLYRNIWSNDEIAGNGVDDDGNGYIDDTWGWDFVNNDNDPMDDMMHGTAVSSVAAGVKDGSGVAGVCPNCKLMSVKVLDALGSGYLDTVAQGVTYAADNGAKVINLSLGAATGAATLEDAVTYAWQQGAVVVAAAGNNGLEQLFYPAAYEHAMAVGSTNVEDYRSCFSNYSDGFITVTAPGEAIVAAMPNQSYATHSGTSLAAPHVTGLAGLLFSQDPTRTNQQVWALIEDSAVDLGPVGKDGYFGAGRVDALRAVTGDTSPTTPPQALYTDDPTATGYAHARKVARDGSGNLHWVWHTQADGLYQVLYATSSNGGQTWTDPKVVFSSSAETYHPALAVDETHVYVAFPSKHGSATYRVFVRSKPLVGGTWLGPDSPILGGAYDAVRPDLHVDTKTEKIHVVASSLDNAPTVYHTWSNDDGANWQTPSSIPVGFASRYADVYAYADQITLAVRTVEFWFIFIPRYHLRTFHSSDGGENWQGSNDVATHDGILTGEYGVSLTGLGNQLKLAYEHAGNIHFGQSSDGLTWTLLPNPLGAGAWPTLSQSSDGQAWALWDRSSTIVMRHYTGFAWEAEEVLGTGTYPNLKAGISGNLLEWVVSRCSAPYCMTYDSLSLGDNAPPVAGNVNQTITEDPAAPGTWTPVVNDPDGNMLTCSAPPTSAQGGEVTVNSNCSEGTYMPALDFYGTDTFTYQACDPGGLCDSGTVSYDVSAVDDAPLANDVSDTTAEDTADTWYPDVSEVDGDTFSCTADAASARGGTVTVDEDCSSGTYVPPSNYRGEDSFNYKACDLDGPCDSGTVSYQVDPVNDPPLASFTVSCSDLACDFDASGSSDLDGRIDSYGWDFGDSRTGTGMTASNTYEAEGTYRVVLTVTDDGGESGTDTQDVTVSRPVTVHVGDLDGSSAVTPGRWEATVTITVQDSHDAAVPGALVEGSWSIGTTDGVSCTTNDSGQCSVIKGNLKSNDVASLTFSVSHVTSSASDQYNAADNHDPDGDSDGTSITVNKPGDNDLPPKVSITSPSDGDTVSGLIDVTADANDDNGVSQVEFFVDGASIDVDTSAPYAISWNSSLKGDGSHTISATATDSAGHTASDSVNVTVGTPPPSVAMHVGDLDGSTDLRPGGRWNATVFIFAEDAEGNQVAGARVNGVWGGGSGGSGLCTTRTDGWCSITLENISKKADSVTFTVLELNQAGYEYTPSANHDPDGDFPDGGSAITIQPNLLNLLHSPEL